MPRLAIVISAVGSVDSLESTLVSVLEHRPADCEVLVALNQAYSDPYGLEGEVSFVRSNLRAPAAACVNRALAQTKAPFVHLLASGCEASEGWTAAALARFGDRRVAAVSPLVHQLDRPEKIVAAGVGLWRCGKRHLVGAKKSEVSSDDKARILGPSCLAAFYRKAVVEAVGGFSTQLDLAHGDVDLARALAAAGYATVFEPQSRVQTADKPQPTCGAFRRALYDERLFWRNLPASGLPLAVVRHLASAAGEMLLSVPRPRLLALAAGRTLAACQVLSYIQRQRQLDRLAQTSPHSKPAPEHVRVDGAHTEPSRTGGRAKVRTS